MNQTTERNLPSTVTRRTVLAGALAAVPLAVVPLGEAGALASADPAPADPAIADALAMIAGYARFRALRERNWREKWDWETVRRMAPTMGAINADIDAARVRLTARPPVTAAGHAAMLRAAVFEHGFLDEGNNRFMVPTPEQRFVALALIGARDELARSVEGA